MPDVVRRLSERSVCQRRHELVPGLPLPQAAPGRSATAFIACNREFVKIKTANSLVYDVLGSVLITDADSMPEEPRR